MFTAIDGSKRREYTMPSRGHYILKGCTNIETGEYWSCNDQYCRFFRECERYKQDIYECVQREVVKMQKTVNAKVKIIPGTKLPEDVEAKLQKIKEKDDEVRLAKEILDGLVETDELTKLELKRQKIDAEIAKTREALCIPTAEQMLEQLIQEETELVKEISEMVPQENWGKDTFDKKKEAASSADGEIVLLRSKRTERKIIPTKMLELYPIKLQELVEGDILKITLTAAKQKMSEEEIDNVSAKITTYTYDFRIKDGRNLPSS